MLELINRAIDEVHGGDGNFLVPRYETWKSSFIKECEETNGKSGLNPEILYSALEKACTELNKRHDHYRLET